MQTIKSQKLTIKDNAILLVWKEDLTRFDLLTYYISFQEYAHFLRSIDYAFLNPIRVNTKVSVA